jgi:surface protein
MFEGCSIGELTLTFNTHHLRGDGMVAMFKNCSNLQTLTISQFTTEQITDMSELFYGCSKMKDLYINRFDMSNVTTLTDMCTGLASSPTISQWDRCGIRCSLDTKKAILGTDEDNVDHPEVTGINRLKVYFPLQGEDNQGNLTK